MSLVTALSPQAPHDSAPDPLNCRHLATAAHDGGQGCEGGRGSSRPLARLFGLSARLSSSLSVRPSRRGIVQPSSHVRDIQRVSIEVTSICICGMLPFFLSEGLRQGTSPEILNFCKKGEFECSFKLKCMQTYSITMEMITKIICTP